MKAIWYVQGVDPDARFPEFFDTKLGAEIFARETFPTEDPDTRYARIFFRRVWEESDNNLVEVSFAGEAQ
jgi:hypothetical protein